MRRLAVIAAAALVMSACQTMQEAETVAPLGVDFSWRGVAACTTASPAFTISNVPAGATLLRFKMTDLDVPSYNHGGGSVAYTGGGEIPAGAFSYKGPCPPSGAHDYQFTVVAIDESQGLIVGRGEAVRPFPPE
ncbi:MAG: YbhB/YbcL family Raf kinase inhibitor-like protein [Marivibrio sp.]|uniref:YbhB/YbcL family Raf kinase inhibitor-like protein n=1 Tax=Marivibrio sp. TaxID=2039719 RepID=UPI0032EEA910